MSLLNLNPIDASLAQAEGGQVNREGFPIGIAELAVTEVSQFSSIAKALRMLTAPAA